MVIHGGHNLLIYNTSSNFGRHLRDLSALREFAFNAAALVPSDLFHSSLLWDLGFGLDPFIR